MLPQFDKYVEGRGTTRSGTPLLTNTCLTSSSLMVEEEEILNSVGSLYRQGL